MTEPETVERVGWENYLRSIEFIDSAPVTPDRPPLHVARFVLLNGNARRVPVSDVRVSAGPKEVTLVEMTLPAHEATGPRDETEDDPGRPGMISGLRVASPRDTPWVVEDEMIRVVLYAAEVLFR